MSASQRLRRSLFHLTIVAVLSAAARAGPTTAGVAAPLSPGNHHRELTVDGRHRSYGVHVPRGYDPSRPTPVVVAFHGALMNAPMMAAFTGLSRKADRAGFVVVYPNGLGIGETALFFNATLPPGADGADPVDDVKFTRAVLDDVATVVNVDRRRVFATGMSNGGMMAHRVAAELADRLAAVAAVAGTLAVPTLHPSRAVPIMMFHGTADAVVPYAGPGLFVPATMRYRSVADTVAAWRAVDGCDIGDGVTTRLPDAAHDGTTVTTTTYGGGRQGSEVVLVTVNGGGHTWPGGPPEMATTIIGTTTANVSANDLMWDFFRRHPMP